MLNFFMTAIVILIVFPILFILGGIIIWIITGFFIAVAIIHVITEIIHEYWTSMS